MTSQAFFDISPPVSSQMLENEFGQSGGVESKVTSC